MINGTKEKPFLCCKCSEDAKYGDPETGMWYCLTHWLERWKDDNNSRTD